MLASTRRRATRSTIAHARAACILARDVVRQRASRRHASLSSPASASASTDRPDAPIREIHSPTDLDAVVPRSHDRVVVVDFYADWCGPCKTLAPALERVVRERFPKCELVKANADAPALAPVMEHLRISSLPTVMGMSRGRFVDQFRGSVPEEEVARFVDALIADLESGRDAGGETEAAETEATRRANGGVDAETVTREATERVFAGTIGALEMDDDARDRLAASLAAVLNAKEGPGPEVKARAFAASAVLALRGRPADADGAKELIAAGKKLVNGFAEPHLLRVAEARLALVREIDAAGGVDANAAREAHEAAPKDFARLRDFALATYASGDAMHACEIALRSVKPGFGTQEVREEGKKLVVALVSAFAEADVAEAMRKRLSNLWFL